MQWKLSINIRLNSSWNSCDAPESTGMDMLRCLYGVSLRKTNVEHWRSGDVSFHRHIQFRVLTSKMFQWREQNSLRTCVSHCSEGFMKMKVEANIQAPSMQSTMSVLRMYWLVHCTKWCSFRSDARAGQTRCRRRNQAWADSQKWAEVGYAVTVDHCATSMFMSFSGMVYVHSADGSAILLLIFYMASDVSQSLWLPTIFLFYLPYTLYVDVIDIQSVKKIRCHRRKDAFRSHLNCGSRGEIKPTAINTCIKRRILGILGIGNQKFQIDWILLNCPSLMGKLPRTLKVHQRLRKRTPQIENVQCEQ